MPDIKDKTIAILAVDGFEQSELTSPRDALKAAGARVAIVSAKTDPIQGMEHDKKGDMVDVDLIFAQADADHFDGVVLPGGVVNADEIRLHPKAQDFVRDMMAQDKPVAVICHGAWLLISAGVVRDRRMTSFPSLKDDLMNAGAHWEDSEVVEDGKLVSSRTPDDLPAFNDALIRALA